MVFEPLVYNLSILMVRPIPLHSFNRRQRRSKGLADRGMRHAAIVGSRRVCDSPVLCRHSIVRLPLLVLCVASMSAYPEESVVAIDDGPALITIRLHHRFAVPQKEERRGGPHFAWPPCLLSVRARFNSRERTAAAKIGEARPFP
jgi:hypothetical protein